MRAYGSRCRLTNKSHTVTKLQFSFYDPSLVAVVKHGILIDNKKDILSELILN